MPSESLPQSRKQICPSFSKTFLLNPGESPPPATGSRQVTTDLLCHYTFICVFCRCIKMESFGLDTFSCLLSLIVIILKFIHVALLVHSLFLRQILYVCTYDMYDTPIHVIYIMICLCIQLFIDI